MPVNLIAILMLILFCVLFIMTGIRGGRALRRQSPEALTVEEGIEVIKQRIKARDALQMVIAVVVVSVPVGILYLVMTSSPVWHSFSEATVLALLCVVSGFLLAPWIRRFSTIQIVRMLEHAAGTGCAVLPGNLHRLMRTYLYYNHEQEGKKPALFDWVRRQLGLYILGLDVRAHIPISVKKIVTCVGLMLLGIMIIAAMLYFLNGVSSPYPYQFAAGTTPVEIDDESEYRGAPAPEGDAVVPQYGTDAADDRPSQEASATPPASSPPSEGQNRLPEEESRQAEADGSVPGSSDARDGALSDSAPDTDAKDSDGPEKGLLFQLFDMIRDALPGQGNRDAPGSDRAPSDVAIRPSEHQNREAVTGNVSESAAGSGDASVERPVASPAGGPPDRDGGAALTVDNRAAQPGDKGEGYSQRPRISRGDGGRIQGQETDVPTVVTDDAAVLQLNVDHGSIEDATKASEQPVRPRRYNPIQELRSDDIAVTPADPLLTQRIPGRYGPTIKKLLSKP